MKTDEVSHRSAPPRTPPSCPPLIYGLINLERCSKLQSVNNDALGVALVVVGGASEGGVRVRRSRRNEDPSVRPGPLLETHVSEVGDRGVQLSLRFSPGLRATSWAVIKALSQ